MPSQGGLRSQVFKGSRGVPHKILYPPPVIPEHPQVLFPLQSNVASPIKIYQSDCVYNFEVLKAVLAALEGKQATLLPTGA